MISENASALIVSVAGRIHVKNGTGVETLKDIEAYKQQKEISSLILYDLHVCAGTGERAGCVVGKLIYLHITYIS